MDSSLAGLSLRDLEYALAVEELRHFGRAAERCGVTQPALSEQIRKLEALLRVTLFERSPRGVTVTPDGAALLRQARGVLREARTLLDMARRQGDPLEGVLRLGVIPTLGPYYLPATLSSLRRAFPTLELRLEENQTAILIERLQQGVIDAALLALPLPATGLTVAPLFFEPFEIVAPLGHAVAGPERLRPGDLEREDFLLLEEGHCLRDQVLAACHGAQARGQRQASSLEMLRHMIAAGEGFSLLPVLALNGHRDLDDLVSRRSLEGAVPDEAAGRLIGLVWRARDPRSEAFRRLAGFLEGEIPSGARPAGAARAVKRA